jgi:hypothetical protein
MSDLYSAENNLARQRLRRLASSLTDEDLRTPVSDDWSVAEKLVHMAFWDFYCLKLLKRCEGACAPISSIDVDSINSAVRELSMAVPLRRAMDLACSAAEEVDQAVKTLSLEARSLIESSGRSRLLRRCVHRNEHLDQIEAALKK